MLLENTTDYTATNGANVVLTGLYDDYGILGIIIFSFFLGAIISNVFGKKLYILINS